MKKTKLGTLGCEVSTVCLGTMTFGSQVDESEAACMVDYALDQGVNFLDTANVYNNGLSEEITGRILGDKRSKVILATKVRGKMHSGENSYVGLSRSAIRKAIDESLQRLNTDYVDIYYLHQPDYEVELLESLEVMNNLLQEGKIRAIGFSNYAAWQMMEMTSISLKHGFQVPSIAQPMYNLLARGIEQEYLAFTKRFDVSNVCYNPLAGGMLSGKQSLDKGPLAGTRFDSNEQYRKRYWHEEYFKAIELLKQTANNFGISLTELSLRWLCNQPGAQCVILGASKYDHLIENLTAAQADPLPSEALADCELAWSMLRGPAPQYNR